MKDWRENEIREGVTIVYPGRHASSMWMTEGIVTGVYEETITRTRRVWDWHTRTGHDEPYEYVERKLKVRKASGKTVTLTRVDRVTVVV